MLGPTQNEFLTSRLTSVMNLQAVFVPTVLLTKLGLCHNFNHVFETLSGRKVTYVMPQQPVLSKSGDNSSSNLPNVQVLSPRVRRLKNDLGFHRP